MSVSNFLVSATAPTTTPWFDRAVAFVAGANSDVQAALVGNAGIALTTLLTLAVTAFITIRQLKQERRERAKDRAHELKRDLLIDGLRGAIGVTEAISRAGSLDTEPAGAATHFAQSAGRLTTAHAVAGLNVVRAGKKFMDHAGPSFLYVMGRRIPLERLQTDVDAMIHVRTSQHKQNTDLLEKQLIAELANDNELSKKIDGYFNFGQKTFKEIHTELEKIEAERDTLARFVGRAAMRQRIHLSQPLFELIAEVRRDIEIDLNPSDSKAYLEIVAMTEATIQEMIAKADRLVAGEDPITGQSAQMSAGNVDGTS